MSVDGVGLHLQPPADTQRSAGWLLFTPIHSPIHCGQQFVCLITL